MSRESTKKNQIRSNRSKRRTLPKGDIPRRTLADFTVQQPLENRIPIGTKVKSLVSHGDIMVGDIGEYVCETARLIDMSGNMFSMILFSNCTAYMLPTEYEVVKE